MLNDIYQGLDPIAFSLGPLVVRWYGLAYVLGFVCAAAIIYFVAKRWKLGMSEDNLLTLMVCAIVGAPLGMQKQRGSSSIGFGISVVVIFIYYSIMTLGNALGNGGKIPAYLAAFLPDIICGVAGVILVYKKSK